MTGNKNSGKNMTGIKLAGTEPYRRETNCMETRWRETNCMETRWRKTTLWSTR